MKSSEVFVVFAIVRALRLRKQTFALRLLNNEFFKRLAALKSLKKECRNFGSFDL